VRQIISQTSYEGLDEFRHEVVDRAVEYVRGKVHTNGCENLRSLLKRGLHGASVSVEPFHLFRYLDEQLYRFNNRHMTDAERFDMAVRGIVGKRLMFDQLRGKSARKRERCHTVNRHGESADNHD
jgi:hypothetical protein